MPSYEAFKGDPLDMPRDAKLVSLILQAADVDDYEPRLIPQLLEFAHRYVQDVLQDSQVFADHAGHKELEVDDVRLAIESRVAHSFTGPPSRETMMELAEKKTPFHCHLSPRNLVYDSHQSATHSPRPTFKLFQRDGAIGDACSICTSRCSTITYNAHSAAQKVQAQEDDDYDMEGIPAFVVARRWLCYSSLP
ncbi:hypothetical protein BASA60_007366 [Batrachochytrium salamandrivorans]|nr:hypothetical protein BASA60_007366 [Batrachochytrium salamandrivorans]